MNKIIIPERIKAFRDGEGFDYEQELYESIDWDKHDKEIMTE